MERFKDSDFVRLLLENGADAEVDNRGYSLGALSSRVLGFTPGTRDRVCETRLEDG